MPKRLDKPFESNRELMPIGSDELFVEMQLYLLPKIGGEIPKMAPCCHGVEDLESENETDDDREEDQDDESDNNDEAVQSENQSTEKSVNEADSDK